MHKTIRPLLAALMLAPAAAAFAAASPQGACVQPLTAYPAGDLPTAAQAAALKGCDAFALYYGIGRPADRRGARLCAHATGNAMVLMMAYANGEGGARNYAAARKAVCEAEAASAETEARLERLARMEAGQSGKNPRMDFCDDTTSGAMIGVCSSVSERQSDAKREQRIAKLSQSWPATHRTALQSLRAAHAAYVQAVAAEVDQSGTMRRSEVVGAQAQLRQDFMELLNAAEGDKLPAKTGDDARSADARLNALWKQLRSTRDSELTTVKLAGIQQAQRRWLAYRDAWLAFAKVRYPRVDAAVWQTMLTQQRVAALKEVLQMRTP